MTLDSFIEELETLIANDEAHGCFTSGCYGNTCINDQDHVGWAQNHKERTLAMAKELQATRQALKAADAAVRCNCLGCNLQAGEAVLCDKDTYWDLRAEVDG